MSRVVELLCSRRVPQAAVLALMSIGFAGCSADMSTRLSQNSFSNPFASRQEATGSVPTPTVERRELPQYSRPQYQSQYQSSALPPPIAAPQSYPTGGGCPEEGAAWPPILRPPIRSRPPAVSRRARWRHAGAGQGGTTIIVGTSDTLEILSRRYNVSAAAIMQANGYKGPRALVAGSATDHSASDRVGCGSSRACRAGEQAGGRGERGAVGSCRQSRRHVAQHRAPQPCFGRRTRQSQRPRAIEPNSSLA